jgi:hypothetical protein
MPRTRLRSRVWRSSVLSSDRAIAANIEIMRSFVRIRRLLEAHKSLARKFDRLERKLASHDQAIVGILSAIRQLTTRVKLPDTCRSPWTALVTRI